MSRHVLSMLVENKPGVLSRVNGLITRRGFNIDSLTVGPTENTARSRITTVLEADDASFEQIMKQLNKLVCVIKVVDLTDKGAIEHELAFFRVDAPLEKRSEIIEIAKAFRATVVDVTPTTLTIEASGDEASLRNLESLLSAYGIIELARTGKIAF